MTSFRRNNDVTITATANVTSTATVIDNTTATTIITIRLDRQ